MDSFGFIIELFANKKAPIKKIYTETFLELLENLEAKFAKELSVIREGNKLKKIYYYWKRSTHFLRDFLFNCGTLFCLPKSF